MQKINKIESFIAPPNLEAGATIGIVATARKVSFEELKPALFIINKLGYKVKFAQHLFEENNQFSGTDLQRSSDLMDLFEDKEVSAILCARGGYGTVRLLPYLNLEIIKRNPKWLIGYSDVTVLHSFIHHSIHWQTIHGSMPINFSSYQETDQTISSLFQILEGKPTSYIIEASSENRFGNAEGILVGGNLSILYSLRGTFADIDTNGKILFIEDLDEYLYHIDRMMMNLKLGGKLENLKALIVGGMSDMNDNLIPFGKTAKEIIVEAIEPYSYPVIFDFPAGHIHNNLALPFGRTIRVLSNSEKAEIIL